MTARQNDDISRLVTALNVSFVRGIFMSINVVGRERYRNVYISCDP